MSANEGDLAYDGSNAPPLRELTARERDILCRIISDIFGEARRCETFPAGGLHVPVRLDSSDYETLRIIRHTIDPRRE